MLLFTMGFSIGSIITSIIYFISFKKTMKDIKTKNFKGRIIGKNF